MLGIAVQLISYDDRQIRNISTILQDSGASLAVKSLSLAHLAGVSHHGRDPGVEPSAADGRDSSLSRRCLNPKPTYIWTGTGSIVARLTDSKHVDFYDGAADVASY